MADICALKSKDGLEVITQKISRIIDELKNNNSTTSSSALCENGSQKQYMETIVTQWSELIDINNWNAWTYGLLSSGQPSITSERLEQLSQTITYLMGRVWDVNFPEVNKAFKNFLSILNDFYQLFTRRAINESGMMIFQKFYKNADNYNEAHMQYEFEVYLIEDLIIELTRATNYICD